ncbi:MAG: anthranilate synthase component I family protein [Amphiplicatus sp.]
MIRRDIEWRSPLDAFAPLVGEPYAGLLQAGQAARDPGWAILVAFPETVLTAREGAAFLNGARLKEAPFAALKNLAAARRYADVAGADAPFSTGLVGFIGYEMGGALEPAGAGPASPFALPDMVFGAYDAAALFDGKNRHAFILARTQSAAARVDEALGSAAVGAPELLSRVGGAASNFDAGAYRQAVAGVIERIRNGALFQANLAQQLTVEGAVSPYGVFRRLMQGDAAFGAYLQYSEAAIVSNSPERFFSLTPQEGVMRLLAEPIKGTRPRGEDKTDDARLAAELLADIKERAENLMIADLTRNDLSRVCRDGSIREEAICELLTLASVHHLVSRISGSLRPDLGAVDAFEALFPCGSVTGAPKIEAMKTIAEVEKIGRGPYCGAIGYIDDRGGADFSVAIRTMIVEGARATFPVGGGVTLRSDPQAEYLETWVKARAMLGALGVDGDGVAQAGAA